MKNKLKKYIEENLEKDNVISFSKVKMASYRSCMAFEELEDSSNIDNYIKDNKEDSKFQKLLFKYIDDRNMKDSDLYNKVHVDRRLFSKIRNEDYHPSKETVILLGLGLQLNIDEFVDLLNSASYSLPKNNYYDLIIRFCFIEGIYNIAKVNDLLSLYDCKLFNY